MKIWLVTIGELLPLRSGVRKMRTAMLADNLVARGHRVRWWGSAFEHARKVMLYQNDQEIPLSPGLTLHLLQGCGYSSNISPARYVDHNLIARKFRSISGKFEPPEVIVTSMPCHNMAFEVVRYARSKNIPVLVDIRDLWPDIILEKLCHPFLYRLGRLALTFDFRRLHRLLQLADGIIAVSNGYLKWGLEKAGRSAREWDRVFYLGYRSLEEQSTAEIPGWLRGYEGRKLLLFIGTFGFSYELRLLLEAARRLEFSGRRDVCFVIAGAGEQAENIRKGSAGLSNVLLPGWISADEISYLLARGYLGLVPCLHSEDTLSNKPFEYLSGGLPLISSLRGELADLINLHGLGMNYRAGDLEDFCRAIETFLDNQDLWKKTSANCLAFFKEYGDADKIYTEYANHIEMLAKAKSGL